MADPASAAPTHSPADIVVTGHLCVDLIPQMEMVESLTRMQPGHLAEVGPMMVSTGGSASNVTLALHKLGVRVALMAPVGDDLMGQAVIGYLRAIDPALTEDMTVMPGQAGSYTLVLSPAKLDRTFLHAAGTNAFFGPTSIDFERVARARILHLGYPPLLPRLIENKGEALEEIYRRAKEAGAVTSMDMVMTNPDGPNANADWRTILDRTLPYVDIFLPSI